MMQSLVLEALGRDEMVAAAQQISRLVGATGGTTVTATSLGLQAMGQTVTVVVRPREVTAGVKNRVIGALIFSLGRGGNTGKLLVDGLWLDLRDSQVVQVTQMLVDGAVTQPAAQAVTQVEYSGNHATTARMLTRVGFSSPDGSRTISRRVERAALAATQ
jgi:hypothetical protein